MNKHILALIPLAAALLVACGPATTTVEPGTSSVTPSSTGTSSSAGTSTTVSSSSATTLSSSSWNPFNPMISYGQMTDTRNSKTYKTIVIAGYEVFAQNMDIGEMVLGSASQSDDTKIEKYCYNDDPANCEKYGGLYQWAEGLGLSSSCNSSLCQSQVVTNQQGICPDLWHVMTPTEWGAIASIFPGRSAYALKSQDGGWGLSGGADDRGFSVVPGGKRKYTGVFSNIYRNAYFWIADESLANGSNTSYINYNSSTLEGVALAKVEGYSFRCTKN